MHNHYTNQELVENFHKVNGVFPALYPGSPNIDIVMLRMKLIDEEASEVADELRTSIPGEHGILKLLGKPTDWNRARLAKELADLLVVTYGTAIAFGIDLDLAFREVMDSNMTKLGQDGKPVKRADGKVLKGPNYRPPDMEWVINESNKKYL